MEVHTKGGSKVKVKGFSCRLLSLFGNNHGNYALSETRMEEVACK